jgi:hypothetical protein
MSKAGDAFNETAVRTWMLRHLDEHRSRRTGEVNWTSLCEAAAGSFDQDYEDGPLDDHTHWIWDLAIDVDEQHSRVAEGSCR